jgi:hypothetical protein
VSPASARINVVSAVIGENPAPRPLGAAFKGSNHGAKKAAISATCLRVRLKVFTDCPRALRRIGEEITLQIPSQTNPRIQLNHSRADCATAVQRPDEFLGRLSPFYAEKQASETRAQESHAQRTLQLPKLRG